MKHRVTTAYGGTFDKKTIATFALVLFLAVGFRLTNIGGKLFWYDEEDSLLVANGHSWREFGNFLLNGQVYSPLDFNHFYHRHPAADARTTVKILLDQEPQNTPVYYTLMCWWTQIYGDTPADIRAGSALLSLLAIPGLVWLGKELGFNQSTTLIAIGLWAVSPFFVVYGQDARDYGLWAALTTLASAAFLYCLRTNRSWWIYGVLCILGLYTKTLFVFVLAAHAAVVLFDPESRIRWKPFTLSFGITCTSLAPWLLFGWFYRTGRPDSNIAWVSQSISLSQLIRDWLAGLGKVIFDVNYSGFFGIPLAILMVLGLAWWWRTGNRRSWWLVACLIFMNFLPLALMDIALAGMRSSVPRFLTGSWLGVILVLAFASARRPWVLATLLLLCLTSCFVRLPAKTWWNIYWGESQLEIAKTLNDCDQPTLLIWNRAYGILPIARMLGDHVQLTGDRTAVESILTGELFLYQSTETKPPAFPSITAKLILSKDGASLWRIKRETIPPSQVQASPSETMESNPE